LAGDRAGYRTACNNALAALGRMPGGDDAQLTAWTCVVAPGAGVAPARVVALAEQAVASNPRGHTCLITLGAALQRAGRLTEAVQRLEEAIQVQGKGGVVEGWLFLALAHQGQGHGAEARQWLDRAIRALDTSSVPVPWADRLVRQFLRAEARALCQEG